MTREEAIEVLQEIGIQNIEDKEDLFDINLKKLLSSLDFLRLVIVLEERYGIVFEDDIIKNDNISLFVLDDYINKRKK